MSGVMTKSLLAFSLFCLSLFGVAAVGQTQSLNPDQEQRELEKLEKHREETKIPAHLFPKASAVFLYINKEGFAFIDKREPILETKPIELTQAEIAKLRNSVFYGEGPALLLGCAPRLHYVFQFVDSHGKELGKLLFWIDGYHEILPATPPRPDMDSVIVEPDVSKIVQEHLTKVQLAALGALSCGA
jgi:hypothetical protein